MNKCKHEALRLECWRVIFLDWGIDRMKECTNNLVGKTVTCTDCTEKVLITDKWLRNPIGHIERL